MTRDPGTSALVSISIVTWNSARDIVACLASLTAQDGPIEIIVIDNASSDDTVDLVRRHCPQARLVVNPTNVGFAAAQVQAWQAAHGRYWLLLNPDTRLAPGALAAMVDFMAAHPRAGLLGPRLLDESGVPQHCAQRLPSIWNCLVEASRLHLLLSRRMRGRLMLGMYFDHDEPVRVGWTWGTALLARREATDAVGPLSTRFFMYGEDLEWCLRMRVGGWEVWFCPTAQVFHHGAASSEQRWDELERLERILAATYDAVRMHRGGIYMTALHAATWLDVWLDAARRGGPARPQVRAALRYHQRALFGHGRQPRHPDA